MVVHNLALPGNEEAPRMPVAARHIGHTLAAMRRNAGYRFIVETDRRGESVAWIERTKPRRG
jgi:hypothetical protein